MATEREAELEAEVAVLRERVASATAALERCWVHRFDREVDVSDVCKESPGWRKGPDSFYAGLVKAVIEVRSALASPDP